MNAYDSTGVETIPQFLKAAHLSVRILRPCVKVNPDTRRATFYPVTITRGTGESLKTGAFIDEPTHEQVFDYLNLVLGVDDWKRFMTPRLRDPMTLQAIGAEWHAYQALRKPLLAFFSTAELDTLRMPFLT